MSLLVFVLVSIALIAIPGPNVLTIVSTTLRCGLRRGLQTVAGTSSAMIVQLPVAGLGTGWLVSALAKGFFWLKAIGAVYLLYLGLRHLVDALTKPAVEAKSTGQGSFQRGFWVSLTNPKTILFFGAFLPQFTDTSSSYPQQIAVLSAIFWGLAVLLDSSYALLAARLRRFVSSPRMQKVQNGVCGSLFVAAGATLALTRDSN